ncbi:hypothetical protein BGY98DRAFT_939899 [Russula aff. rugulosa BPL654]|nr:hypothetical protein BGY98DRAFT_939899 [Russula aff. rugulosa BPL654]
MHSSTRLAQLPPISYPAHGKSSSHPDSIRSLEEEAECVVTGSASKTVAVIFRPQSAGCMCTNDGPDVMTVYPRKLSMYDSLDDIGSTARRSTQSWDQEIPEVDPDTMPDAPAVCAVQLVPTEQTRYPRKDIPCLELPEKEESNKEPLMKGKDGVETGGRPLRALIRIMHALMDS